MVLVVSSGHFHAFQAVLFHWNFGPIPWQAAEIIGGLFDTESQSDRVTDTQVYSVYGWVKFFCA